MLDFIIRYYVQIVLAMSVTAITAVALAVFSLFSGVRALLRNEIIGGYNHYMAKDFIPIYAMENISEMYIAYHRLGGNGTITKLVEELKKLPSYVVDIGGKKPGKDE